MNFQPLGKRVLIKRVEETKTTSSGIIIPDNAKEKPLMGEVIAVSKEINDVSSGDKIMFSKYGGTEIKLDNDEYLVLNIDDILGILK
ncbi:co-chaperone GroES [Campylobacter sp. LH-2024]|uniref:co-chaperone GroES n=1 Tax=Campylobacter TaxID=194 RepID=UPI001905E109|nr:co-chaperone GroES [Campylobacter sp. 2018MI35]MBZ7932786.1 co-chaperone GroES [Campylobacter sp. RM10543]MBZ7933869.1 co-chaperone GroES [Campylobacter sp. W0065]MBZ7940735.1 co-chaperone GroES [Campylobacter sp. W0047]MBZ7941657.1 co-chaperone GroES [Campylobacter sp. W0045]MBZ7950587.1 co-chaperone GroES [Campylobacter sp. W0046]MBZ7959801.1 co-chaperone GroES [Campylobacter sp. RM12397]MBZ7960730.1 co-chaperone GroES [Campylobacter sp. RM9930]MBZ7967115.1 co-chaperone GroES [Campylob